MNTLSPELFAIYFSPYTAHMIEYSGVLYATVEHAYHCQRYVDPQIIEEIRQARSPMLAWKVSQKYKAQQLPDFNDRKRDVMKELFRAKMQQHDDVKQILVDSGDSQIVKHISTGSKSDGFWDDGEDGTGRNESGKMWMELREELKQ